MDLNLTKIKRPLNCNNYSIRYWYNNGCLFPEMGSVFIPVDKCTKENGCLKVLDGSHKMGRINHILEGDQAGADPERYTPGPLIVRISV